MFTRIIRHFEKKSRNYTERDSVWSDEPMYIYGIDKDIFSYPLVICNEILL